VATAEVVGAGRGARPGPAGPRLAYGTGTGRLGALA